METPAEVVSYDADQDQDDLIMPTASDKPGEECAVFGVFNSMDSAAHLFND